MVARKTLCSFALLTTLLCLTPLPSSGQGKTQGGGSFMVQCPITTPLHPTAITNPTITSTNAGTPLTESAEPAYTGPVVTSETVGGVPLTYTLNGGAVKCQEISGGDGYMTEADGNQTFMFAFGPLSGLDLIKHGQPGTLFSADFNQSTTVRHCPVCAVRQRPRIAVAPGRPALPLPATLPTTRAAPSASTAPLWIPPPS